LARPSGMQLSFRLCFRIAYSDLGTTEVSHLSYEDNRRFGERPP
jgi:hypothetical protein